MATKHFFDTSDNLVNLALKGTVATNPSLRILESQKTVYYSGHTSDKVSVLSGGGSGHEPAHSGYVGKGMLTAAVCGDVFASPSARQVQIACERVSSDEGYIFVVTNYTGDMLHFGLAKEKMLARGARVGIIQAADDVAVGRTRGGKVGRRGLAGTNLISKIVGAAAESGQAFDTCMRIGKGVGESVVTISAGLDHCHLPGRETDTFHSMDNSECDIGMGIHNEPGTKKITRPRIDDLVDDMLNYLLDGEDQDRAYVPFNPNDENVLLINNLGGISILELRAVTELVLEALDAKYGIRPSRVYSGTFMTSLNAPAVSITLLNVTHSAHISETKSELIMEYLDAPTEANSWPTSCYTSYNKIDHKQQIDSYEPKAEDHVYENDLTVSPKEIQGRLRKACENIIAAEPNLTEWDTEMGDGDCGTTLESGAKGILHAIDELNLGSDGSLLTSVSVINDIVEDKMGGTLGAIFGIYLAALCSALANRTSQDEDVLKVLSIASKEALESLQSHTPARKGDRTVMDVLIPFVDVFISRNGDINAAVETAKISAQETRKIRPRLGRATYVGGTEDRDLLPPDPGAWGLYEILEGLAADVV